MAPLGSGTRVLSTEQLAVEVASGAPLPELPSPVLLGFGEVLHAEAEFVGWRFRAADVIYEQYRPMATGLLTFGLSAVAAAIGNRRAMREAEQLAAPQWRALGLMPALATNQRLLVFQEGAWQSVWYSAIRQLLPRPAEQRLELIFEADAPYLLVGEWVPYLTVVITTVLAGGLGVDAVAAMLQIA